MARLKQSLLLLFISVISYLAIAGCEQFTGYDYDAEEFGLYSNIHGKVSNIFTHNPVTNAQLTIGIKETRTDELGQYNIYYLIGTDEDRNRPIDMRIAAHQYYPYDTSLVIFPVEMPFNISLTYAAPILEQAWFGVAPYISTGSDQVYYYPVTQVMILDHQGIASLDSVTTTFYYARVGENEYRTSKIRMKLIAQLSGTRACYQAVGPAHAGDDYLFYDRQVSIVAKDNESFCDTLTTDDPSRFVNSPFYPVQIDDL